MRDRVYYDFYKAAGFKVYSSQSTDWCEIQRGMLISIPFHRLVQPTIDELEQVLDSSGAIGLRYPTSNDNYGFESNLMFCRSAGYGFQHLLHRARNQVKKGQKYFTIKQVDFTELAEAGLQLNRKTCQRQNRDDPKTRQSYWEKFCEAGRETKGAVAFGAYYENQLAAYLIVLETATAAELIVQSSDSDLLALSPNNVLTFAVTQHYLGDLGMGLPVCYGLQSLEKTESLDRYKISMGYQPESIKQSFYFRESVRWLIQPEVLRFTDWLQQKMFKKSYFLRKTCGMMRCYLAQNGPTMIGSNNGKDGISN